MQALQHEPTTDISKNNAVISQPLVGHPRPTLAVTERILSSHFNVPCGRASSLLRLFDAPRSHLGFSRRLFFRRREMPKHARSNATNGALKTCPSRIRPKRPWWRAQGSLQPFHSASSPRAVSSRWTRSAICSSCDSLGDPTVHKTSKKEISDYSCTDGHWQGPGRQQQAGAS